MVAAHFLANQLEDGHHLTIFYKLTVNLLLAQNSFGSVDSSDIVTHVVVRALSCLMKIAILFVVVIAAQFLGWLIN